MLYSADLEQNYGMIAQLGSTDFMKDVDSWMKSAKEYGFNLTIKGEGQYQIQGDGFDLNWAVDGKQLYFGNDAYQPFTSQGQNRFEGEAKGALLFAFIDLSMTNQMANSVVVKCANTGELSIAINMPSFPGNILKLLSGGINVNEE